MMYWILIKVSIKGAGAGFSNYLLFYKILKLFIIFQLLPYHIIITIIITTNILFDTFL